MSVVRVVCPFHAWKFDMASGEPLLSACGIDTYPVRCSDEGDILLTFR